MRGWKLTCAAAGLTAWPALASCARRASRYATRSLPRFRPTDMKTPWIVGLLAALPACGQREPPASDLDYFPMRDGTSWTYLHSGGAWQETVTMSEGEAPGEFVTDSSPDPNGLTTIATQRRDGDDVFRTGKDEAIDGMPSLSVTYDPGFLRFSNAWLSAEAGDTDARTYERTEALPGMDPQAPVLRAHVYTIESVSETVTVPAGTFHDCLRVRRARDLEVPGLSGLFAMEEQEKLYWFCAGAGKTREENVLTGSSEVLVEYSVPEP